MTSVDRYSEIILVLAPALAEIATRAGRHNVVVTEASSLVDDLGIDSLHLIDVAVCIEERTGIRDFSVEHWVETESLRRDARFTVGSLVRAVAEACNERINHR